MSKKVVHLSDDAHELAKAYCKDSGMKMSDWVAMLIKRAVDPVAPAAAVQHTVVAQAPAVTHAAIREPIREAHTHTHIHAHAMPAPQMLTQRPMMAPPTLVPDEVRSIGPKKKPMLRELSSENEDSTPVYAQPPFWARSKSS